MAYQIRFHPEALSEYSDAYNWYEQQSIGLGDKFELAVEDKLEKLVKNPELYHFTKGIFRECAIPSLPYVVVYSIYPNKNVIFISALHHTGRNSKTKFRV